MTRPDETPPTPRVCDAAPTHQGERCPMGESTLVRAIDVSHWNGVTDWRVVADWLGPDGFAYVKVTEGHDIRDPLCQTHLANARAVGRRVGVYHFARFTTAAQAEAEARHFLDIYGDLHEPGDLAPALDLEEPQLGHADIGAPALVWLDRVADTLGVLPIVYTSPAFALRHLAGAARLADFPLWCARWGEAPPTVCSPWPDDAWVMWQYGKTHVPGVVGECDVNRARKVP